MAENKTTLDDQNKQTNEGANDDRLAPMNEEQREIASKGGKAEPVLTRDAGHEDTSAQDTEDEQTNGNSPHRDQSNYNSDDETGARGGMMGGSFNRG